MATHLLFCSVPEHVHINVTSCPCLTGALLIYPIKFRWLVHQIDCGDSCTQASHAFTCRKRPPRCRASPQRHCASDGVSTRPRWPGLSLVSLCNCKRRGQEENSGTQSWQGQWPYLLFHAFSFLCSYSQFRSHFVFQR